MKIRNMEVERLIVTTAKTKRVFVVLKKPDYYIVEELGVRSLEPLSNQPKGLWDRTFPTRLLALKAVGHYVADRNKSLEVVVKSYGLKTLDKQFDELRI